jgi:hypothetical protein
LSSNTKLCKSCGIEFTPKNPSGTYCSKNCGKMARFFSADAIVKNCKHCETPFRVTQKRKDQVFCSTACRDLFRQPLARTCDLCGVEYIPHQKTQRFCSLECRDHRGAREERTCEFCGATFVVLLSSQPDRRFCSQSCVNRWKPTQPEIREKMYTEERTAKLSQSAKERWAQDTPEVQERKQAFAACGHDPETTAKMAATLRRIGHKPKELGGKGRPLPAPQQMLLDALGSGWEAEITVNTGWAAPPWYYSIDVGNKEIKVAIEADGGSHSGVAPKKRDARKDALLKEKGWTVLRFSNQEILSSLSIVVEKIQSVYMTLA